MAIGDVQDLLVEHEVREADFVENASEPQMNKIDSSSHEDNNFTLKN